MTLTLKDLCVGDCFRCTDGKLDDLPTYADTQENSGRPNDLPKEWDACNVDDKNNSECKDWWRRYRDAAVELLEHYIITSGEPVVLKRKHIRPGECFMYLDRDSPYYMVANLADAADRFPIGWIAATPDAGADEALVRRIPRWDHAGKWTGLPVARRATGQPTDAPSRTMTVTKVVSNPITVTKLDLALAEKANGMTGAECLRRLELAMRHESLARPRHDVTSLVSTYAEGLDIGQVELGKKVWSLMIADRRRKDIALAKTREVTVLVDGDYEPEPWGLRYPGDRRDI